MSNRRTSSKLDTRAIGLDVSLTFARWLTGKENLHYGYWEGLDVCAANAGTAQEAYTERLFGLLPAGPLRILDIGGGAGETAKKLVALGHTVDIVIPSAFLAERCRANAPSATVHMTTFEGFSGNGPFDICLFSESFQYVALDIGLRKALGLLTPGGHIILADCFRPEGYVADKARGTVGGGHRMEQFRAELQKLPLSVMSEEDITEAVAPSVEIEQGLFNVVGHGLTRVDEEMARKQPRRRWLIHRLIGMVLSARKRARLATRLMEQSRNREVFAANNTYLMMVLKRDDG